MNVKSILKLLKEDKFAEALKQLSEAELKDVRAFTKRPRDDHTRCVSKG